MKSTSNSLTIFAATAAVALLFFSTPALAVEVLVNGGLEDSAGPEGWAITQSITGEPASPIGVYEHLDGANEPMAEEGELGILVKPFAGNTGVYDGQNKMVNFSLSQTVAAPPGTYTLTGHSYFQGAASNILDTLHPDSPSGAVPSPTETFLTMEFLNAANAVLGMQTLDLRTDPTVDAWRTHSLMGTGPAGTTKVRVTVAATDMVASCTTACPFGQDVLFDNFTLRNATTPGLERLTNNELNQLGAPGSFTIEKTPQDNLSFAGASSFAANTGAVGMWLRSFSSGDAKILQSVPGVAGGEYEFSAFSKWETGYNGADPLSNTQTFMTMEFLDGASAVLGTETLDLRTVQINDGTWRELSLDGTAPAGTVSVRVSAGATGMANSGINPQSAFFDDFSLMLATVGVPGDYNANGTVDAADYVLWRNGGPLQNEVDNPGTVNQADYDAWKARFGNTSGAGSGVNLLAVAVPEPAGACLFLVALVGGLGLRRRGVATK